MGVDASNIEMRYEDENIWLTQRMMAELYAVSISTINEHITRIYNDSELQEEATIRNFRIVQQEGKRELAACCLLLAVSRYRVGGGGEVSRYARVH